MNNNEFNKIVIKCAGELSVGNATRNSTEGHLSLSINCENPVRTIAELILLVTSECEQALSQINDDWWLETEQHIAELCEDVVMVDFINDSPRYTMCFPSILFKL